MTTKEHAWDLEDGFCHTHRAYCSMATTNAAPQPARIPAWIDADQAEIDRVTASAWEKGRDK